jgi:HPt (histidine-containing phosphotransfer) domain-containing protein
MSIHPQPPALPGRPDREDSLPVWKISPTMQQFHEDGDYDWIRDLIDCFLEDTAGRLDTLSRAAQAGPAWEILAAHAHALKGSARDLGAGVFAGICARLEHQSRERDQRDLPSLLTRLATSFDELRCVLTEFQNSLPR